MIHMKAEYKGRRVRRGAASCVTVV
jgi:hypothetical protein